jgi:hypothetical protein
MVRSRQRVARNAGPMTGSAASRTMIHFPSWPGFAPAVHVFLARLKPRRGCPAQQGRVVLGRGPIIGANFLRTERSGAATGAKGRCCRMAPQERDCQRQFAEGRVPPVDRAGRVAMKARPPAVGVVL